MSAIKRLDFVNDRISYVIQKDHCFNTIVLNVHAPAEDKIDYKKDSFYGETKLIFHKDPM
jgi:hypothetical protein